MEPTTIDRVNDNDNYRSTGHFHDSTAIDYPDRATASDHNQARDYGSSG
jgi:hypothetical protein